MHEGLNKHFTKEDPWMANKDKRNRPVSQVASYSHDEPPSLTHANGYDLKDRVL